MAIALVAHPALGAVTEQISEALPVAGLYYPARSHRSDPTLPFYGDLTAMLEETGARTCAFLSPYQNLHKDVKTCLETGVDVLCGGPIPQLDDQTALQSKARLTIGGVHHSSALFNKALQQRLNPSFAQAVYLRLLSGAQGPGLLPAWWAACKQWTLAIDLLGETPLQLHISAYRQGRAYQIALTAAAMSGTTVQLLIAPQRTLTELTLLGTGGTISASSVQNGIALSNAQGTRIMPDVLPPAEIEWLRRFEHKNAPPQPDGASISDCGPLLLRGLRQALRQKRPIALKL
ncbi:MAG TPA: hypothetical protein EYG11_17200 [Candidatus Latescibacteria bacterium]|nr:hypothetical protein [Candidatus Handelsmanbacteria bacterium]HIL10441.1 hypothetical protein [Candidatus Latescibacterota bacterium]